MDRQFGGTLGRVRVSPSRAPALVVLAAVVMVASVGCEGARPSATPTPTSVATATPAPTPTPVPTPPRPSIGPTPGVTAPPATGGLVVRLTTCDDACGPMPGTTVLDDGRIIWESPGGRLREGRLTGAALAAVRATLDGTPSLATSATYAATLRPGADPIPHGVATHRFEVARALETVVVTAWDPDSLADQLNAWIIPPEMYELAGLAELLATPAAWLGENAFTEAPAPYVTSHFLVVIDLVAGVGEIDDLLPEVDDVVWPFGGPIEAVGDQIGTGEDRLAPRCLFLESGEALVLRAAEAAVGATRDLRQWATSIPYNWRRGDGFVQVTLVQLLPYETGSCAELVLTAP